MNYEIPLNIIFFIIFHFIDMLYTTKYINILSEEYKNPEEVELNYHKHLFKKFGIIKGGILSWILSTTIATTTIIIAYNIIGSYILYIAIGMSITAAYKSFLGYIHKNDKPLERIEVTQEVNTDG